MTIDNERDEKWSSWIDWNGGDCPLDKGSDCEIRFANGSWVREDRPEVYAWASDVGGAGRIIAYRYKIQEPSGISEADEEECIQLAYERINEESVKVSVEELHDNVNKPKHYQSDNGIECIDAIRAALGLDGFVAHCRGTAIKYCWRSGKKEKHAEDLRKAAWYLNEAAEALEE